MAFSCEFSSITATTAIFTANFSGGQASYSGWRMVKLSISNSQGSALDERETVIISSEKGSGSSSFSALIQGLKPETEYGYTAEIGYGPSNMDDGKITWLGSLDEGGVRQYSTYGSFETTADGSTSYFTASEMELEKYAITFYASFSYDATISPYVTEMDKLTILYSKDQSMSTGVTTLRFDATKHDPTGDGSGIYEWDDVKISGLDAGTTYYWKAYCCAQAQAGTVSGYITGDSTTLPPEPNALSLKILPFTPNKAVLTATYYDAEAEDLEGFKILHYKLSTNGGQTWGSYQTCTGTVDAENHFIMFNTQLNGLSSDTEYSYRAYVGDTDPWS